MTQTVLGLRVRVQTFLNLALLSDASMGSERGMEALSYTISGCSSFSGKYKPENVMHDLPMDPASRWNGAHHSTDSQWILLKLQSVSVVQTITFGKHCKSHPCNMKEFRVLVGLTEDTMTEVLHTNLEDTTDPETFTIEHKGVEGVYRPSQFVKVIPVSGHNQQYHVSIWHIALAGVADPHFVDQVKTTYEQHSETNVLRHVLKYLRQRRLLSAYQDILTRSGLRIEHPLVTQLHEYLVLRGNWEKVEVILHSMADQGLFDDFIRRRHTPRCVWKRLLGTDMDGDKPSPRGGHAMCIDQNSQTIYLFGGWDGKKSLDDFWAYDISLDRWRVLSHSTSAENGPSARACHKMVFDPRTGKIYVLGSLDGSTDSSGGISLSSDFYCYHTSGSTAGKWDYLAHDTSAAGGPPLVFDHQMVLDSDSRMIYVFGGRIVDGDWDAIKLSNLFSFNITTSKWRQIQPVGGTSIPSRFGHSMVLEPMTKKLFVFAGQREDTYLSDMYTYNIHSNSVARVEVDSSLTNLPSCFTQRAVIDSTLREIYVFCGLIRGNQRGASTMLPLGSGTWLFSYDPSPGKWIHVSSDAGHNQTLELPQARFAHQVVYDSRTRTVFLHGGNGGTGGEPLEKQHTEGDGSHISPERLDDFWCMQIERPNISEVVRKCAFFIRQQQFREMCNGSTPMEALTFLQNDVHSVVNHDDPEESASFRALMSHLISPGAQKVPFSDDEEARPRKRSKSDSSESTTEDEGSALPPSTSVSTHLLRSVEDPLEKAMRKQEAGHNSSSSFPATSGTLFSLRNDTFEKILEFLATDESRQPSEELPDLIRQGSSN